MTTQQSLSLINDDPQKPRQFTECAKCGAWWTGFNTCHCTACHTTFTGITAFDKHRTGSHSHDTRHCLKPDTVGLTDAGRSYPCWANPGTNDTWNDALAAEATE